MSNDDGRQILRLAEHLASLAMFGDCTLVGFSGEGRCIEPAAGVKWEDGFADLVCEQHATYADARGALVVWPNRHDGTLASPLLFDGGGR